MWEALRPDSERDREIWLTPVHEPLPNSDAAAPGTLPEPALRRAHAGARQEHRLAYISSAARLEVPLSQETEMNENQRPMKTEDEQIRRSGTGGPIPADDLSEQELREAEDLGDGSPAVEPRRGKNQHAGEE